MTKSLRIWLWGNDAEYGKGKFKIRTAISVKSFTIIRADVTPSNYFIHACYTHQKHMKIFLSSSKLFSSFISQLHHKQVSHKYTYDLLKSLK